jgi:hypothetical protein
VVGGTVESPPSDGVEPSTLVATSAEGPIASGDASSSRRRVGRSCSASTPVSAVHAASRTLATANAHGIRRRQSTSKV